MIEIRKVEATAGELRRFVKYGIDFYGRHPYYVPPLVFDDVNTLRPDKNPAFEFCRARSFMAYRDSKPVGRITALINEKVNERTGKRDARFGFLEMEDDAEVTDALFRAAERWALKHGMDSLIGPMGFTDLDHEGMLVEGFDELSTMATIYNPAYYPEHMERMGYRKEADWIEFQMTVPPEVPEKMARIAGIVEKKYGLRTVKYNSAKRIKEERGQELFRLINECYDGLYGYSPLTPKQIEYYIDMYLSMLNLDFISCIVDRDDRLVGVGITIPSLSRALQRSRGRLYPMGWWHMLRALRGKTDTVDLLLVAIKPEFQNKGVNAMLFTELIPVFNKYGMKLAESNLELEDNTNVQGQWQYFERRQHRRRRVYRKELK